MKFARIGDCETKREDILLELDKLSFLAERGKKSDFCGSDRFRVDIRDRRAHTFRQDISILKRRFRTDFRIECQKSHPAFFVCYAFGEANLTPGVLTR